MDGAQTRHLAPSRHRKRLLQLEIPGCFREISTFHFSGPEKPVFSQRRCKIRALPWARGNFHACYSMVHGHSWEVGIYLVVRACTVFFPSYCPVYAVSNYMY